MFKPPKTHQIWKKNDYLAQKKGVRNTIFSVNGDEFTGEWLDNMKHGKGTYVSSIRSSIYSGDWSRDEKSGFGTYSVKDANGEYQKQYAGGWKNNFKHVSLYNGYGTRFYKKGEHYEGEWYRDQRSGWGRMKYKDGSTYDGEWLNDKRSGMGLLRTCDNNRYEGSWKNGLKNGPGKYFYTEKGQVYEGVWVDNIAKCGNMLDNDRENAPDSTPYCLPKIELADPVGILEQTKIELQSDIE